MASRAPVFSCQPPAVRSHFLPRYNLHKAPPPLKGAPGPFAEQPASRLQRKPRQNTSAKKEGLNKKCRLPSKIRSAKKMAPAFLAMRTVTSVCFANILAERVCNMTDWSNKLSQISKSSSSLKNDSTKKHCQISCSLFFFFLFPRESTSNK